MESRILVSVKKTLSIGADDPAFDEDVLLHINSAFSTLNQLGIGPVEGFAIEDDTAVWDDFVRDDARFNSIKTYVYLFVRLLFDPPQTSYAIDAANKQLEQLTWRLNVLRESEEWTDPTDSESEEEV